MASSGSGLPARRSPSSPTSASTPCSTAARSRRASRPATASSSSSTRTWAWSPRSSTRRALNALQGHIAIGHTPLLDHRWQHLGERAADARRRRPPAPSRSGTTATSPTPPSWSTSSPSATAAQRRGELARGNTTDTALITALLAGDPDHTLEATALEVLPAPARRVLPGLHGRAHALRRPRPARRPPAGARPARAGLGRRQRDRRPRHRRRLLRPRGRARRAHRDRRRRPAQQRFADGRPRRAACSSTSTWPGRTPRSPAARCTPPASRWAGASPSSTPSRPTWSSRSRSPARPPPSATRPSPASRSAQGLTKNAYVGRTFIQPSQTLRQLGIRLKLNPLKEVIRGKRLVVVDDSIVRGNTQRALVRMLREAGAAEVHVRISSPPVQWPCFYGIDFASRAELIATGLAVDEVAASLGADSLGYISLEGMIAATEQPASQLCAACFTGSVPDRAAAGGPASGKILLEQSELPLGAPEDGLAVDRAERRWRAARWTTRERPTPDRRARSPMPPPGSTPRPVTGRRADEGRRRARRTARRCSAASAGSPGCSTPARCWPTAARCWPPRPTASAPRSPSRRRSTSTTPSGSTWWAWSSTTSSWSAPTPLFMTDYIACGTRGARADRRHRARDRGGVRAWPAPRSSAARPRSTRACSAPDEYDVAGAATGVVEADRLLGPERVRAGDVRRRARLLRAALQRLLAGAPGRLGAPAGRWTGTSTSWAARSARSSSSPPASTPPTASALAERAGVAGCTRSATSPAAGWPPTWRACCPQGLVADDRPRRLDAAAGLRAGAAARQRAVDRPGGHAQPRRRAWWPIVAPDALDGVLAHAAELGLPAWELGTVRESDPTTDVVGAPGFVAGTKGVHGGAVQLSGAYRA